LEATYIGNYIVQYSTVYKGCYTLYPEHTRLNNWKPLIYTTSYYSTVQFTKVSTQYSLHILCQLIGSHLYRQMYLHLMGATVEDPLVYQGTTVVLKICTLWCVKKCKNALCSKLHAFLVALFVTFLILSEICDAFVSYLF
jgi:hypothetical protein